MSSGILVKNIDTIDIASGVRCFDIEVTGTPYVGKVRLTAGTQLETKSTKASIDIQAVNYQISHTETPTVHEASQTWDVTFNVGTQRVCLVTTGTPATFDKDGDGYVTMDCVGIFQILTNTGANIVPPIEISGRLFDKQLGSSA